MTIPGIGPATALMIMAEAGELRRFAHDRQFLAFFVV
jgi:transposase